MLSEIILSKSLNQVVFQNRNQSYGAFYLRNEYENHIRKAFAFVLLLFISMGAISFISQLNKGRISKPITCPILQTTDIYLEPKLEFEKPKLNIPQQAAPQQLGSALPTQITNEPIPEPTPTSSSLPITSGDPKGVPHPSDAIPTTNTGISSVANLNEKPKVFNEFGVQKMAEFPGGEEAMQEYLNNHIHFTNLAKVNEVEGKVIINFIIDENGKITECKIVRSLGFGLDEIAMDAIRKMPNWIPAEQAQRKVPVMFTMPILFSLSN
ncbi:MAG: hypothetical protein RJA07_1939 [Bacteroidota bacterium]|jgi:protein TonB